MRWTLLLSTGLLLGCISQKPNTAKEIVETYFEAAFAEDYALLDSLLDEDFEFVGPKVSNRLDKQSLMESWRSTHRRNDSMQMLNPRIYDVSDQEALNSGQSLILHYYDARFHNTDLEVWVEFPVHVQFHVQAGKIEKAHIIMNQSDVQQQLGYTIIPPEYRKQ